MANSFNFIFMVKYFNFPVIFCLVIRHTSIQKLKCIFQLGNPRQFPVKT